MPIESNRVQIEYGCCIRISVPRLSPSSIVLVYDLCIEKILNTVVVYELVYPVFHPLSPSSIVLHRFGIRASIYSNTLLLLPLPVVTLPCSNMTDSEDIHSR
jgi:hypothetical protein